MAQVNQPYPWLEVKIKTFPSFREGKIELEGYSTRYREGLDLVLKQVSATIQVLQQKSDNFNTITQWYDQ